jgi:hypothetical protein
MTVYENPATFSWLLLQHFVIKLSIIQDCYFILSDRVKNHKQSRDQQFCVD